MNDAQRCSELPGELAGPAQNVAAVRPQIDSSGDTTRHCRDVTWLPLTVDRSPYKQGRFLPGNHIPIYHPDRIREKKPDYVVILPWNLKDEIMEQLKFVRDWGGRFVVPIPKLAVC